jgi:hypothetical protein
LVPEHAVPSVACVSAEHIPVPEAHMPATWQASLAVHMTEAVPVHTPPAHAYESHLLDPEHAVPSASCVCAEHVPVLGLHVPAAWHASLAGGHTTGLEPVQTPPWQAYVCSHLFVPTQGEPHAPQLL